MRTRTVAANTATVAHAAIDLALIVVLGSVAELLDRWDARLTHFTSGNVFGTRSEKGMAHGLVQRRRPVALAPEE